MKNLSVLFAFILLTINSSFAQGDVDMATGLRSEGKIYVVILVLVTIFLGLAAFLFLIDRRVSKLERKQKDQK